MHARFLSLPSTANRHDGTPSPSNRYHAQKNISSPVITPPFLHSTVRNTLSSQLWNTHPLLSLWNSPGRAKYRSRCRHRSPHLAACIKTLYLCQIQHPRRPRMLQATSGRHHHDIRRVLVLVVIVVVASQTTVIMACAVVVCRPRRSDSEQSTSGPTTVGVDAGSGGCSLSTGARG